MSFPEISRRCRSCGAAVRAGARFCPQCGKLMEAEAVPETHVGNTIEPPRPEQRTSGRTQPDAPVSREAEPPLEVEPTREAEPTRETGSPREWTPPMKEFSAFVEALESEPRADSATQAGAEAQGTFTPEPTGDEPRPTVDSQYTSSNTAHASGGTSDTSDSASQASDGVSYSTDDAPHVADASPEASGVAAAEGARGRVARVREGTRVRVERMREEALVVLEETPDDSGLRFVVAAAALFLIFLFLLFLSTTVLR